MFIPALSFISITNIYHCYLFLIFDQTTMSQELKYLYYKEMCTALKRERILKKHYSTILGGNPNLKITTKKYNNMSTKIKTWAKNFKTFDLSQNMLVKLRRETVPFSTGTIMLFTKLNFDKLDLEWQGKRFGVSILLKAYSLMEGMLRGKVYFTSGCL